MGPSAVPFPGPARGEVEAADHGQERVLLVALLGLTAATGLVDAFSYLVLGHVFVANMTGNVVFLGFALGGAPDFSIAASLLALVAFVAGAAAGGRMGRRLASRTALLAAASALETGLIAGSAVLAAAGDPAATPVRTVLIGMLAIAMGVQNAVARRLAVPDLTTTVLTLTITGLAADGRLGGGRSGRLGRRGAALGAMLTGALVGAWLIGGGLVPLVLVLALGLTLSVAVASFVVTR